MLQRNLSIWLFCVFVVTAAFTVAGAENKIIAADPVLGAESNILPQPPLRFCKSIDVRTLQDLALLENCTHVLGHVSLVNLQLLLSDTKASRFNSAVEEISDYLLVHRVNGVYTLSEIFPRLQLIRGRHLLFDEYALVVYENRDLSDLGLGSLLRIQKGNVRVESNPSLCYVETINWVQLLGNTTQQHFWHKNNKLNNYCPLCASNFNEIVAEDSAEKLHKHCWNYDTPQRRPPTINIRKCRAECGLRGCDENNNCCDHNCLSGCDGMNCDVCANLKLAQRCVDDCPTNYYQYQERECITASKCRQLQLIPHDSNCLQTCPKNHYKGVDDLGHTVCKLICTGDFVIHVASHLEGLSGCTTINGSLILELTDVKFKITDLERELVNISEITGYLKVVNSPQLLSLQFLRNLITIRGDELIDGVYAIYVVDNYHLSGIWAPNQKVSILRGRIYFHLNPRLCFHKIMALNDTLKSAEPLTSMDVSPHSNGERVVCHSSWSELNVTIEDFNSTAVRLKLKPIDHQDLHVLLGYMFYYKEAPIQNITLYDGQHGCGHDNWHMDITAKNVRHIISHLKPFTQYACFVKTLTMTSYHMQRDAYSKIKYFRTLPSKPGPVKKVYYHAISTDTIIIHWWPPRMPNGNIEKYLIYYEKVDTSKQKISLNTHADFLQKSKSCECVVINPEESGPAPSDENYYNKDKLIYEETLPNLLFVNFRRGRRSANPNNVDSDKEGNSTSDINNPSRADTEKPRKSLKSDENSPNDVNKIEEQTKEDDHSPKISEAEQMFLNYMKSVEDRALKSQDTGPDDFPIIKQRPVCPLSRVSVQYQLQNDCRAQELFEGIEVPGHIHSYTLNGLEPEVTYRITLRACVADLKNGCGVETAIYAETVSRRMEQFIESSKSD